MGPFRKRKVDHRFFHSHLDWHPPAISIVAVPNFHRRPRRSKFLGRLAFSKQVVDLSFFKSATPPPPSFHESGNLEPFHFLTDLSSNDPRNKSRSRGSPLPDRSRNFALSFRSLVVLHSFFLFFFFFLFLPVESFDLGKRAFSFHARIPLREIRYRCIHRVCEILMEIDD